MTVAYDVSVVMAVYNGGDGLGLTIDSVLSQEGVSLEFIIVNDGSTDGTAGLLDRYAERDFRVRVFHQDNAGLTHSLIRGCAEARAPYIARQDAGDRSLPGRLQLQHRLLDDHPACSFVSCWTRSVAPQGEFLRIERCGTTDNKPRRILDPNSRWGIVGGPSHHTSVMFRVSSYRQAGGYRQQFRAGQDWDLWYRLAELGTFAAVPEVLCEAAVSPGSISSSNRTRQMAFAELSHSAHTVRTSGQSDEKVLQAAEVLGNERLQSANSQSLRAGANYFIGRQLQRNGDRHATHYLVESLRNNPTHWRALAALGWEFVRNIWAPVRSTDVG